MSYSYVKSVFPEFKYSNVYDTKLYDESLNKTVASTNKEILPAEQNGYAEVELNKIEKIENQNIETFQNNLKFYNKPRDMKPYKEEFETNVANVANVTNFTNVDSNHSEYIKHILGCASCKEILMKQFNIESDRVKNEEIMELISFIMIGIFVLLLIDNLKK
jgi:DNA replicative helicase MCM subunit Mcm2 (Cdc46/Mcm family)